MRLKSEAWWPAVKEYKAEELASDSEDEKRIRKAQERVLRMKKQNAAKKDDKEKVSPGASRMHSPFDDRLLFRGIGSHSACLIRLCCVLCFSVLEKENFPSYERSEEGGKCIF